MGRAPSRDDDGAMTDTSLLDQIAERSAATRVVRWHDHRMVAGVARGIAARYDIDPVVVRVGFVITAFLGSIGIAAYLLAWVLLPDDRGHVPLLHAVRERAAASIALVVVAVLAVLGFTVGVGDNRGGRALGIVALLGVGYLLWRHAGRRPTTGADGSPDAARTSQGADPGPSPDPDGDTAGTPVAGTPAAGTPVAGSTAAGTTMPVITPWGGRDGERLPAYGAGTQIHPATAGAAAPPRVLVATPSVPRPARPRRRSLGWRTWALALGLALTTATLTGTIARAQGLPDLAAGTLAAGATCTVIGLLVLVLGLRGYRTAGLAPVALVLALLTMAGPWASTHVDPSAPNGEMRWQPAAAVDLQDRYEIGAGEASLDLTRLSAADLDGKTVRTKIGLGDLTIRVPADVRVQVRHDLGLGEVRVRDLDGTETVHDGAGRRGTDTLGTGPTLTLDVEVGLGEARVERIQR